MNEEEPEASLDTASKQLSLFISFLAQLQLQLLHFADSMWFDDWTDLLHDMKYETPCC